MNDKKYYFWRNLLYVVVMLSVLTATYFVRERSFRFAIYGTALFIYGTCYYFLRKARSKEVNKH